MFRSIVYLICIYCNVHVNVHIQNMMLVELDLILEEYVCTHFIESNVHQSVTAVKIGAVKLSHVVIKCVV